MSPLFFCLSEELASPQMQAQREDHTTLFFMHAKSLPATNFRLHPYQPHFPLGPTLLFFWLKLLHDDRMVKIPDIALRRQQARGFTLAELLIVLMLVVVLVAVTISFYQTHTIRSQVSEGLALAGNYRSPVEAFYQANSEAPADLLDTGIPFEESPDYGDYVVSVRVVDGRIDTTFGNLANTIISDTVLSLTPYETPEGEVLWRCALAPVPEAGAEMLTPLGSSAGGRAAEYSAGSIPARYLPAGCK